MPTMMKKLLYMLTTTVSSSIFSVTFNHNAQTDQRHILLQQNTNFLGKSH